MTIELTLTAVETLKLNNKKRVLTTTMYEGLALADGTQKAKIQTKLEYFKKRG